MRGLRSTLDPYEHTGGLSGIFNSQPCLHSVQWLHNSRKPMHTTTNSHSSKALPDLQYIAGRRATRLKCDSTLLCSQYIHYFSTRIVAWSLETSINMVSFNSYLGSPSGGHESSPHTLIFSNFHTTLAKVFYDRGSADMKCESTYATVNTYQKVHLPTLICGRNRRSAWCISFRISKSKLVCGMALRSEVGR